MELRLITSGLRPYRSWMVQNSSMPFQREAVLHDDLTSAAEMTFSRLNVALSLQHRQVQNTYGNKYYIKD